MSSTGDRKSQKKRLVNIFRHTKRVSKELYGENLVPSEVIFTTEGGPLEVVEQRYEDCHVKVVNGDTFTVAQRMVEVGGLHPLVLNMASDRRSGGGVRKGSTAQEECLFRCSNYILLLDDDEPADTYPLGEDVVIYSSAVTVFKNQRYEMLETPFEVACLACPGVRKPRLNESDTDFYYQADYELTCQKVESIFRVAYDKGHDSILLGALGCGAFRNPPEIVAQIFAEKVKKYRSAFRSIGFAVMSRGRCENFDIFEKTMART